jgi:3-hydroxyacyl-[acyl-carrier-protein] dehydratase
MDQELQIRAPLEHPCYAGHFPGNPIVPGVVLLDLIAAAVGRGAPRGIGNVKFLSAVKPGDSFTLRYRFAGPRLDFRCHDGDRLLLEGSMTFGT